jgi:hypothetical protein
LGAAAGIAADGYKRFTSGGKALDRIEETTAAAEHRKRFSAVTKLEVYIPMTVIG